MDDKKLISLAGLVTINAELKKYIDEKITGAMGGSIVQKNTYLEFPTVGTENAIYIDQSRGAIYRWNESDTKYYLVVENIDNLKVVDGLNGFLEN